MAQTAAPVRSVLDPAPTPYVADEWERYLSEGCLTGKYPSLVHSLREGFDLLFPQIAVTQAPKNRSTVIDLQTKFDTIVAAEIIKKRYTGPFTCAQLERLIGPFQSSPFSIIEKPGKPGRYRLVQNFSFPFTVAHTHGGHA